MNNPPKILIVEDEELALANLEHILKKQNYEIVTAGTGSLGLELVRAERFDVVLTDLRMEKVDGMQILEESRRLNPSCEVIMITGYATVDSAIEAMKKGAYHYISKPYRVEAVRKIVAEALEKIRLRDENVQLKEDLKKLKKASAVQIITKDPAMSRILATAAQIAATDCNVLITGESGTGKELLARFIHEHSPRQSGPFLAVNCGVFNEELLTNELFGHEKGAFTGAHASKPGLIELAKGGTLFLDEITEMSPNMQVKLLRVIQERQMMRVGGTTTINVDVRFIAATNRNIQESIQTRGFRKDLYYRLNVVSLELPPLAARKGDIPLLAQHFLDKHAKLMGRTAPSLSKEVLEVLSDYDFPGNVRELENIIERGIALSTNNVIGLDQLPDDIREFKITTFRKKEGKLPTLEELEVDYIKRVLEETGGNKTLAASTLGIDRVSLWRKIRRYGLE
jgi:two-component system response regulator HydG|uniref:Sigma-54-dependent Fis family transcriptional regulator n=1 Tax=Desulfomonile tiedjei TaxID=2358 RepID=A0A7C4ESZ2_9BACT